MTEEQYKDDVYYRKDLANRNFKATNEALKKTQVQYAELKDDIKRLESAYAQMVINNNALTQKVNALMAKVVGTGATE